MVLFYIPSLSSHGFDTGEKTTGTRYGLGRMDSCVPHEAFGDIDATEGCSKGICSGGESMSSISVTFMDII